MKIVYLAKSVIPSRSANSIHVMKMCQAFGQLGHTVTLLRPNKLNVEQGVKDVYSYYGVEACFNIRKLNWSNLRGRDYLYGLLSAATAKKVNADLIYGRHLFGCALATFLGLPVAYEAHGIIDDKRTTSERMFSRMVKSQHFRGLVVISKALKRYYQEQFGIEERLVTVAPDGADEPKITMPLLLKHEGRLQLGYIGSLYPGKGMETIELLAGRCKQMDFHIVGGTEGNLSYWRNRLKERDNVLFHGFVPHAEVARYHASFDVLLAPFQQVVTGDKQRGNIADWMSPLKIFEYMAAGKAILCSDLPVLREILTHEATALLCRPEAVDEWEISLLRLQKDQVLRKCLGQAAREEFKLKYTWLARAERILNQVGKRAP